MAINILLYKTAQFWFLLEKYQFSEHSPWIFKNCVPNHFRVFGQTPAPLKEEDTDMSAGKTLVWPYKEKKTLMIMLGKLWIDQISRFGSNLAAYFYL